VQTKLWIFCEAMAAQENMAASLSSYDGTAGVLVDTNICRGRGGNKLLSLPDFFIGAHAAKANLSILIRDPSRYQSYFPRLVVLGGLH
jgi:hypothetical protein